MTMTKIDSGNSVFLADKTSRGRMICEKNTLVVIDLAREWPVTQIWAEERKQHPEKEKQESGWSLAYMRGERERDREREESSGKVLFTTAGYLPFKTAHTAIVRPRAGPSIVAAARAGLRRRRWRRHRLCDRIRRRHRRRRRQRARSFGGLSTHIRRRGGEGGRGVRDGAIN